MKLNYYHLYFSFLLLNLICSNPCYILSPVSPLYYSVASNAWHRAKPIPLCRAVPWCRRCLKQNLSLRREQAPALRCNPIITQIGRGYNISAEICLAAGASPRPTSKHPYEKERKGKAFLVTLWRKPHSAFGILHSAFCVLHSAFCILRSAFCILHSAFCILHSFFTLHSLFCTLSATFR